MRSIMARLYGVDARGRPLPITVTVKGMSAVSRKNQITIPAQVMRDAGLAPGDDVRVRAIGPGRIELVRADELLREYAGSFDETTYPTGYLDEVRRGWA
jgi:AbrB family looped-hinge helix DNA binding protein